MRFIPDPTITTEHPEWCSRAHCTTAPNADVDHRAAQTTLDVRPFDDRIARVVVVRSDESTPDGPLSGATGVELRITTGDLNDEGSPVFVDVFQCGGGCG